MRVILDTNVLFDAFVTQCVCAGLYEDCLLQADTVVSNHIQHECDTISGNLSGKLASQTGRGLASRYSALSATRGEERRLRAIELFRQSGFRC